VCIFTETYYPVIGGGETQARILAEGLISHGYSVCILTRRTDASLQSLERLGQISVRRIAPVGRGQMKKWGMVLSCLPALVRLRNDYDVLFVSGFRITGMSAIAAARLFGKTVVLKADSQGEMSGAYFANGLKRIGLKPSSPAFRLFLAIRNRVLRTADAFVAITDGVVRELEDAGVRPEAIHRISNGVDTGRFFPACHSLKSDLRIRLGIPPTAKVVVYTGRLVSYKGLPLLLEVWRQLAPRHCDARLVLVGAGGLDVHNCEADLRTFVAEHGLGGSVTFTGNVDNVPDYLQAADVFVLPSEDDAFPSSLVEAMACRLAVVATPVGAVGNIVQDGQTGLMVHPGDFPSLYEALDRLLQDDALVARLAEAGWRRTTERYSAESVTQQLITLFGTLRGNRDFR
jgi:glycosyltransferase involved in cell wall biosynthesis